MKTIVLIADQSIALALIPVVVLISAYIVLIFISSKKPD
jgi:hypothetical protein